MKISSQALTTLRVFAFSLLSASALLSTASAQSILYWGGNGPFTNTITTNGATNAGLDGGTWNTTNTNFNDSLADTTYTTWVDNSIFGYQSFQGTTGGAANITLGANFAVAGVTATLGTNSQNQTINLVGGTSSTDHTITLADNGVFNLTMGAASTSNAFVFGNAGLVSGKGAAILAGNNFTLSGIGSGGTSYSQGTSLSIYSNSTISGTARINGGALRIGTTGSGSSVGTLANITSYDVIGVNSLLNITQGGATNAVNDTAVIRLAGGILQLNPNAAGSAGLSETVDKVILEGLGTIVTTARSFFSPTVASTLTLTNGLSRGDNGKGVLVAISTGTVGQGLGTTNGLALNGQGFAAANTAFIPYGFNLGSGYNVAGGSDVTTTNSGRFMATDSSGKLGVVNSTAGNTNLSTWASSYTATSDIFIEGATTITGSLSGNTSIRSLAIGNSTANNTFGLGGNTLKLSAIGAGYGKTTTIGSATNDGTITANGTSGGDIYFIQYGAHRQASSMTINSVIANNGGTVNVIFANTASFGSSYNVNGTNTYTGKTFVGGPVKFDSNSLNNTSELNIATGGTADLSATANRTFGGGSVSQKIAGGGGTPATTNDPGLANINAATRNITIGALGTLAPGDTGANETFYFSFSTGKLTFTSGATLALDFGAVASSDQISFIGSAGNYLAGSGLGILNVTTGSGFTYGVAYTAISNVTTSSFTFGMVKLNGATLTDGVDYTWGQSLGGLGTDYQIVFTAVPEPSTYAALAGVAILGFATFRRRRRA